MAPLINFKITNILVLLTSLILTYQELISVLEGRMTTETTLLEEENLERQLSLLNKPPLKTIHAIWGDTYDCIEFHKQPAFDHPLLKDHKIEMWKEIISTKSDETLTGIDGCPEGTVPIRRTTREDLIRAKSLTSSSNYGGGQCRAGVSYDAEKIYGAKGAYNVWNPTVKQDQFSSAELSLQSGSEENAAIVKLGWTVDPQLYGGNKTRGFIYWTVDGGQKTGCYNTLCRGFVQVHDRYTPDAAFSNVSIVNGTQAEFFAEIILDKVRGRWWMIIETNITIGYWPNELFPAFSQGAKHVYWGGRVQSDKDGVGPPMGSGQEIDAHSMFINGYVRFLEYIDKNYEVRQPESTTNINDCTKVYAEEYFLDAKILKYGGHGGAILGLRAIKS
ncbi:hypothetical protein MKX03_021198 [Papaver bracteatum]|nr:hypothetical protein MKX03_021198 [Papaver bracteatum]